MACTLLLLLQLSSNVLWRCEHHSDQHAFAPLECLDLLQFIMYQSAVIGLTNKRKCLHHVPFALL